MRIELISKSPYETWNIGEYIGRYSEKGDLFTLYGELGSGKTQLVKGIAKGMGVADWQYVVSPSFTIMNIYEGKFTLCHVDLYRIGRGETEQLQIEEFLESGIVVVEWADKAEPWEETISIHIDTGEEQERKILLEVQDVSRAEIWRNIGRER